MSNIKVAAAGFASGLALAAGGLIAAPARPPSPDSCPSMVGAWYVDAIGAPFAPHAATFHADSTVVVTNPDAAEAATSSSAGMGVWKPAHGCTVTVKFVEVNADRASNTYTTTLVVAGQVTTAGDGFSGPVQASYYDGAGTLVAGPFAAVLKGQRITIASPPPTVGA